MDERRPNDFFDNIDYAKIDPDTIDTGEPIAELRTLSGISSVGLLSGIRRSVNRRSFAANTVDFSLMGVGQVFVSYLNVVMEAVFGNRGGGNRKR